MPGRARFLARWFREQVAFLLVVGVLAAAFVYLLVAPADWRAGIDVLVAGVLLAALLRAALPTSWVGMLAVRGRVLDALACLLLGGLILAAQVRLRQ